jgi:hypothetical protein
MLNEFEKQVQQKIEELKLVPSEPVWQKVEMQIRKKKDRRRLVLWILFLVLLLGGGLWIGIDQYSKQVSYESKSPVNKITNKSLNRNSVTTSTANNNTTKHLNKKSSEEIEKITNNNTHQNEKVKESSKLKNPQVDLSSEPYIQNIIFKKIGKGKEQLENSKKEVDFNKATNNEVVVSQSSIEKKLNEVIPSLDIVVKTDTTIAFAVGEKKPEPTISAIDSIRSDSVSIDSVSIKDSIQKQDTVAVKKTNVKKYASSKWKSNLVTASGLSGLSRLNVFNGLMAADSRYYTPSNSASGPGVIYARPSPVKKALSFSIGGSIQKQLSKRLLFSAGLQYKYYSNTIMVGNKIVKDTVLEKDYSVSQYFTNRATSYSMDIAPYRNHYHLISLPLAINWQIFKKLPLNLNTGFSIQQMIETNALTFGYNAQAYYHNDKAFNKTLLFTEYGLSYSMPFNKTYLTIGPELQYGLTRLEKNNPVHHLFSYGLKAQLQLNKK